MCSRRARSCVGGEVVEAGAGAAIGIGDRALRAYEALEAGTPCSASTRRASSAWGDSIGGSRSVNAGLGRRASASGPRTPRARQGARARERTGARDGSVARPVDAADGASRRRDDALASAVGRTDHGDLHARALQDERDRAPVGRVDGEAEERRAARRDMQWVRAGAVRGPRARCRRGAWRRSPIERDAAAVGRERRLPREGVRTRARARVPSAPIARAAGRASSGACRGACGRPGPRGRVRAELEVAVADRMQARAVGVDRGRCPSPPSGPRGTRSSGRRATRRARGRGRARAACRALRICDAADVRLQHREREALAVGRERGPYEPCGSLAERRFEPPPAGRTLSTNAPSRAPAPRRRRCARCGLATSPPRAAAPSATASASCENARPGGATCAPG